jgi:hypothetical protein
VTYNASSRPKDLSGGRVADKDQVALLNTIMNILRSVLMKHASVRLPIVEGQPATGAVFWVEPCAVCEETRTSKRVVAKLKEIDDNADQDSDSQDERQYSWIRHEAARRESESNHGEECMRQALDLTRIAHLATKEETGHW